MFGLHSARLCHHESFDENWRVVEQGWTVQNPDERRGEGQLDWMVEDCSRRSVNLSVGDGMVSGLSNEFEKVEQEKPGHMKREGCEKMSGYAPPKVIVVKLR